MKARRFVIADWRALELSFTCYSLSFLHLKRMPRLRVSEKTSYCRIIVSDSIVSRLSSPYRFPQPRCHYLPPSPLKTNTPELRKYHHHHTQHPQSQWRRRSPARSRRSTLSRLRRERVMLATSSASTTSETSKLSTQWAPGLWRYPTACSKAPMPGSREHFKTCGRGRRRCRRRRALCGSAGRVRRKWRIAARSETRHENLQTSISDIPGLKTMQMVRMSLSREIGRASTTNETSALTDSQTI